MSRIGIAAALALWATGSALFAWRMWNWVLNFDPGFEFKHAPIPTGSPSSEGVTVLLVDGLRLDASRAMPALNILRGQGADIEATVSTPSFSRPGRATVAVGAPPAIHGVTTNRQNRAVPLDNIIREVGAGGGACRVAGSKIWSSLFGADIEKCGVYRQGESKEGPGAFVRQIGEVRRQEEAGIAFVLQQPAKLRIADVVSTDFAAHEYGGKSPEYLAEVRRTDTLIADLAKALDLSKQTLIVTADHGHRDQGGHGGEEAEVLAIPIVMVGAGIRPESRAAASQSDLAPTIAALLGVPIPSAASGAVLESVLVQDDARRAFLKAATDRQREAFERAVGERLGRKTDFAGHTDWESLVTAQRNDRKDRTLALLAAFLVFPPSLVLVAVHFSRGSRAGLFAGTLALLALLLGPLGSRVPTMSFSAINYDEMLLPFFRNVMALSVLGTLAAILVAGSFGAMLGRKSRDHSVTDTAGLMGLVISTAWFVAMGSWWWWFDLLSPLTLPGPDRLVQAFSLTLATLSTSLAALAVMAVLAGFERSPLGNLAGRSDVTEA